MGKVYKQNRIHFLFSASCCIIKLRHWSCEHNGLVRKQTNTECNCSRYISKFKLLLFDLDLLLPFKSVMDRTQDTFS